MQEWRSRLTSIRNLKRAIAVLTVLLIALSAAFYYDHNLTDAAWARRAYDVAEKFNVPDPIEFYRATREDFLSGNRSTAKGHILDAERRARERKKGGMKKQDAGTNNRD